MAEVKKPQNGKGVALVALGMCALFFVLFFLGLVKYYGKSYAATEMTDAFKDIKTQLDMLKDALETIFKDKSGFGLSVASIILSIAFPFVSIVWFIMFFIRVLFCWKPLSAASNEKITWEEAADQMDKKVRNYVKEVLGYIVCAFMMCGGAVEISAFGIIFAIAAIGYYIGRRAFDDKAMISNGQMKSYLLNVGYTALKAISLFLVIIYALKSPLMVGVVGYVIDALIGFLAKKEMGDIIKLSILPFVGMLLAYLALGKATNAIESHVQTKEEKAKKFTKGGLILSIIATVFTAVYYMFILSKDQGRLSFADWFKGPGEYFVMVTIFFAVSCAVFLFEKLIAVLTGAPVVNAEAEAEAAATEDKAE